MNGAGNSNSTKSYNFVDSKIIGGSKFAYRLKQIANNGAFTYSSIQDVELILSEYILFQNYPNPFNPSTSIQYALSSAQFVTLKIYDALGTEVAILVSQEQAAGVYQVGFNSLTGVNHPASGIYFYRLQAGKYSETKKMILMK